MSNNDSSRQRDFADALPETVEGDGRATSPAHNPGVPAGEASQEKYDRSAILGHDGRVIAGWALRFIVVAAAVFVGGRLLGSVWVGLLPIILALIICTVLWPPTRWMRNKGVPAALASLLTIIVFLAAFIGIFAAMAPTVISQGRQVINQAGGGLDSLINWVQGPPLNLDLGSLDFDQILSEATSWLQQQSQNIASGVFSGLSTATSVIATIFIMAVVTFFMLKDGDRFLPMVRRYSGASAGWHLSEVLTRSWHTLSGFIRTQAIVSLVDAVLIGVGLVILNVPLALVLAVLTFFGGFIPIIGAFTAGALAVLVALVTNGFTNALFVLILILLVQQLEGNILQPVLQSKALNLHAAVVLLSVTVGSALFGIIGAFLAVPAAAVIAVWLRYHSEMVALRAGEITVDDVEIATSQGQSIGAREAFLGVRDRMKTIATRKSSQSGSTNASKVANDDVAEEAVEEDATDQPPG